MDPLLASVAATIAEKKERLDRLRPVSMGALRGLQKAIDVDLTYTSNAIEGNTLTLRETAEIIEHGITVGGKTLRDHLEAVDHYDALLWMREIAAQSMPVREAVIRELHRRIVMRSQPDLAGMYSRYPRRIAGSSVVFPNPIKIPALMHDPGLWLERSLLLPAQAFETHYRLTAIHPFGDGNGRTARLLMNMILIRGGYPPIAVRVEDRRRYLDALEHAALADDLAPFQIFLHERLETTLADYIEAVSEALPDQPV